MESDPPITCETKERALQQGGPCLGAPILQNLGHIERRLARMNAVGIGAMPQRELAVSVAASASRLAPSIAVSWESSALSLRSVLGVSFVAILVST